MTVRLGDLYVVESLDQFQNQLSADWYEIADALPDGERQHILDVENTLRDDEDRDPVESLDELSANDLEDYLLNYYAKRNLIEWTLDARPMDYTYVIDDHIHRIIELHAKELALPDIVRKVRLTDADMTVTIEEEPDDIHAAIEDALPGAAAFDYRIEETFTTQPYGNETGFGRDA